MSCEHKWEVPKCEHCGAYIENKPMRCVKCGSTVHILPNEETTAAKELLAEAEKIIRFLEEKVGNPDGCEWLQKYEEWKK